MPANIQVILQQDVDKLGKSGELVRVRPGFARNFLLPRQLAVAATSARSSASSTRRRSPSRRPRRARRRRARSPPRSTRSPIKLSLKAGEDGKLFGSVATKDLENAVKAAAAGR